MSANDTPACSINLCTGHAVHSETAESDHWRFTVHYCAEHHRQIANGTPIGPLGVDASHVSIEPLGTSELRVPARQPSPTG